MTDTLPPGVTGKAVISTSELLSTMMKCITEFEMVQDMHTGTNLTFDPAKYCMLQLGGWSILLLSHSSNREGTHKEIAKLLAGLVNEAVVQLDQQIAQEQMKDGVTKQ